MGALDTQYPLQCNNPERVVQAFTFTSGAAGAVTATSIGQGGAGWAFTRVGVGSYTFTFPKCVGIVLTMGIENTTASSAQKAFMTTALNASAGTGGFVVGTGGGLGTTELGAGDKVHFIAVIKYKNVD